MDNKKYNIPRLTIIVLSLLQLAISEIYINTVNLLFIREAGFHLFLHIFIGVLTSFVLIRASEATKNNVFLSGISVLGMAGTGFYNAYLIWMDYQATNTVIGWDEIGLSLVLLISVSSIILISYIYFAFVSMQEINEKSSVEIAEI